MIAEIIGGLDTPLLEYVEITVLANAVILEAIDVVLGRRSRAARQVNDRVVTLAGFQA